MEAIHGADIILSASTVRQPVVAGRWLKPGVQINAIDANHEHRRALDQAAVLAAQFVCEDDLVQVRYESTDLAEPVKVGVMLPDLAG